MAQYQPVVHFSQPVPSPGGTHDLTPIRRGLVYLLTLWFLLGHGYDIITWTEHWPFSRYPMYSRLPEMKVLPKLRVVGVSGGKEIPLTAERHFAPFNAARLSAALVRLGQLRNQPELFQSASRNLIQLYENSRRQGLHNDPPLQALRIYQTQWQLDPWARNVDTPDIRQLLVEVTVHGDTA